MHRDLLLNHFMGKSSAIQKQMIAQWILIPGNEEIYYQHLEVYESTHLEYEADLATAIQRYNMFVEREKLHKNDNVFLHPRPVIASKKKRHFWFVAALLLCIFSFSFLISTDIWTYQKYSTTFGETKTFQLPDGSSVSLNANSSLRIPRWNFNESTRRVFLEGEGSFSVKHTQSHQKFIVQTAKQFEVEVLGTEFTVFSRARGSKVILRKGKVQVSLQNGSKITKLIMIPGELILIDNQNNTKIKKVEQPKIQDDWKESRYVFEQTSMREIVYILEENYGLQAHVENKELLNLTISGTFTAKTSNDLLELLETVFEVTITQNENTVYIN